MENDLLNISLNQGKKFNSYIHNPNRQLTGTLSSMEGFVGSAQEKIIRPSYNGYVSVLQNQESGLNTNKIVGKNDLDELTRLKTSYNRLMLKYTNAYKEITTKSLSTLNRLSSNNPYLNKNIRFRDGTTCYVTNQGIAKPYTSWSIYKNTIGKNGCPKDVIKLNIPWSRSFIQGAVIPTNPELIVGPNMIENESCGAEGKNVYVSALINNPSSEYIGCYNDRPAASDIVLVPVMNNTGEINGFKASASSIYMNNNNFAGPWCAFDNNVKTWWHSSVNRENIYDRVTGNYIGSNSVNFLNLNGENVKILGEFLEIKLPNSPIAVTKYSIQGRQGCCGEPNGRDPHTWYILGYNNGQWHQVDYQTNISFKWKELSFNVINPKEYSAYLCLTTIVGDASAKNTRNCVQISKWTLITSSNSGADDQNAMILASNTSIDRCQEYAVDNEYQYYGIQNYNSNGTGVCAVSNDITSIQMYGDATGQTKIMPIWATNTSKTEGSIAKLGSRGRFFLLDRTNNMVWESAEHDPYNCAIDYSFSDNLHARGRNLAHYKNITLESCKSACTEHKRCHGIEMNTSSNNECWLKSRFKRIKDNDDRALYQKERNASKNCQFMLILQDDGNMCIYEGTPDNIKQPSVWNTKTNGKQMETNSEWEASKNSYGRNYIIGREFLSVGQWISSNNGSVKLIMQGDGNLVLYTSQKKLGCKKINDTTYGEAFVNAVYKLNDVGNKASLGKIAYIDSSAKLREYSNSMMGYTDNYNVYENTDSAGNDITSSIVNDQTECKLACNELKDCAGYVYQDSSKTCWLKNSSTYPNGAKEPNNTVNFGARIPSVSGSSSCSNKIVEVDSIQYDNYTKGSAMTVDVECNESLISQKDKLMLDNIKAQLNLLGQDISTTMERMYTQDKNITTKLNTNTDQFNKDLNSYKNVNLKIKNELELQSNSNIEGMQNIVSSRTINDITGMLNDTNLRVIQSNYGYLLWSIITLGIIIITINTMRK